MLVWLLYAPEKLSKEVLAMLADSDSILLVSYASLWELLNKVGRGKLALAGSSVQTVLGRVDDLGVTYLPISRNNIVAAAVLPHHHSDPFDRVLIAQALEQDLTLVSVDRYMGEYGVKLFWA